MAVMSMETSLSIVGHHSLHTTPSFLEAILGLTELHRLSRPTIAAIGQFVFVLMKGMLISLWRIL